MSFAPWQTPPYFPTQQTPNSGGLQNILGSPQMQQFALQLLANSGYSPVKRGFGEIAAQSMLQAQASTAQQRDEALRRQYMEAQIAAMQAPTPRKPMVVAGPDGKPVYVEESEAIGKSPYLEQSSSSGIGNYQPGDYTPASWAKFIETQNPAVLERYTTPRQDYSPSYQNVTRTNPDGSTQQGTFNTRTGEYNWSGEIVPPGKRKEADAAGQARGEVTGTREATAPTAYAAFKTSAESLEKAMSGTETGPVAGRLPPVTAAQQTAEGAEASMAPILKQLFRSAGEGTFTDRDQELLMRMVPTRKDHPEARKAKMEMIDSIVRAKMGLENTPEAGKPASPRLRYNPKTRKVEPY